MEKQPDTRTDLQKQFEAQTPSIQGITGTEYLQIFITWLHHQIESQPSPTKAPITEGEIKTSTLSGLVADLEKTMDGTKSELSEVKSTMIVNWGSGRKPNPKLLDGSEKSALQMFLKIIEHYHPSTQPPSKKVPDVEEIDKLIQKISLNQSNINYIIQKNGGIINGSLLLSLRIFAQDISDLYGGETGEEKRKCDHNWVRSVAYNNANICTKCDKVQ